MQMLEVSGFSVLGLQFRVETSKFGTRLREALWELLFRVAVTLAASVWVTAPAAALNVVNALPAGTVTDDGTDSAELSVETPTLIPPEGAISFRVTVQAAAAPEFTLVGVQIKAETVAWTRLKVVASSVPFKVALTVALWFVAKIPAVAVKFAEVLPGPTVTDVGIVSRPLSSDRVTVVAEGPAALKRTVQLVDAPEVSVLGLQFNEVTLCCVLVLTVPPVVTICIAPPAGVLPSGLVTLMEVEETPAETLTLRTAITPFWMILAFRPLELSPVRKHV